ncbi:hypothetical protein [Serratia fonticola]|uniref:hypothetical protein n=1 Tax=Serratia fonticola TaxID=47917 RepID=UPI0021BD0125|nr:hypothetical protein [Serratia fonticola]
MAVTAERKLKLERMAIDGSQKAGRQITWTDIVNHLIDNYGKDAVDDLIQHIKADAQVMEDLEVSRRR